MGAAEGTLTPGTAWQVPKLAGRAALCLVQLPECMQTSVPYGPSHPYPQGAKPRLSSRNAPRKTQSGISSLPSRYVEPPTSQLGEDLLDPPPGLWPQDRYLIKQQDEVDGKCQEEGQEPQRVEVPRQVVLERERGREFTVRPHP